LEIGGAGPWLTSLRRIDIELGEIGQLMKTYLFRVTDTGDCFKSVHQFAVCALVLRLKINHFWR